MPFNDHQIAQHQIFRMRFTELNEIFAVMSLRSFVTSMIGIFVPIYMYTLGFSLADIFLMHIFMFSTEFVFEYVAAYAISKFGPKHAIAISFPFLIAHLWMLSTVQTYGWPIWLIGVLGGISLALYWQGYHFDFSKSKKKATATMDVSRLYILLAVLGAISPFIGGTIATYFGFDVLYGFVFAMLMLAAIPLIWFKEKHTKRNFSLSKISLVKISRDIISYGGAGIEGSVSLVILPIFVFLLVGTYQRVGFITSAALVLSIGVTYVVGRKVDNSNRHNVIKTSSLISGLIYIVVIFVDTFAQIISLNFARSLVGALRAAPYVSEYYLHADDNERSEYIFVMEAAIDLFRLALFSLLYASTFVLADSAVLTLGLVLGGLGAVLTGLMPRAKCEMPYCSTNKSIRIIPKLRPKNATN